MGSLFKPLPFAALTVLAWGSYGNWLHKSSDVFPEGGAPDDLRVRQFFCVGLAYFILAIVVPTIFLRTKGEKGAFTIKGIIWSLAAGVCGALGALGIIIALNAGGKASFLYVMPLVFGCAPVVNTLVSMTMNRSLKRANSAFFAGIVLVAVGAAMVFLTKPAEKEISPSNEKTSEEKKTSEHNGKKPLEKDGNKPPSKPKPEPNVLLTGLSWGTYGTVLHKGQAAMQGSRLRPLICVGLSYFVVAVVIPLLWIQDNPLKGMESGGMFAFMAGVAGAVGAFGIILSFTYGGRPIYVMPLVFGGAPIVNTLIFISIKTTEEISPLFVSSLTVVIVGAVLVLVCQPKAGTKPPPEPEPEPEPEPKIEADPDPAEVMDPEETDSEETDPEEITDSTDES